MAEKGRRQQPGFACEECRRRKARCDRTRPRCGLCMETGTVCVILDKKQQRGPKKGQLNAMRSQIVSDYPLTDDAAIATLQWQLSQQMGFDTDNGPPISGQITPERENDPEQAPHITTVDCEELGLTGLNQAEMDLICASPGAGLRMTPTVTSGTLETAPLNLGWADWTTDWNAENIAPRLGMDTKLQLQPVPMDLTDQPLPPVEPMTLPINTDTVITDHMRADLDQVYFDRVHPVLPIIYRPRFFPWADQENPGAARACLRSAMRTMAAAMSAPGCRFCDQLYAETCQMLQAQAVEFKDKIVVEYIQAWLLVGHYELLRVGEHQAMLTAGRCFRLVLMARLFDIDAPGPDDLDFQQVSPVSMVNEEAISEGFSVIEEQRRTFWLAFCLDRFLCSRNEYPLTLPEEMICTRLPAPEENFQNNQQIRISFLPEAMAAQGGPTLSPFAECIIMATLHGRCMAHRRSFTTKQPPGTTNEGGDFWTRQKRLTAAVDKRMQVLNLSLPANADSSPLLLFTHMLAHSALIKLGQTAQRASTSWRTVEQQGAANIYERRASTAAGEMVRLAKQIPSFSCFKGHPFLPDPLACAASYLTGRTGTLPLAEEFGVQHVLRLLRDMQGMNSLARVYFL